MGRIKNKRPLEHNVQEEKNEYSSVTAEKKNKTKQADKPNQTKDKSKKELS